MITRVLAFVWVAVGSGSVGVFYVIKNSKVVTEGHVWIDGGSVPWTKREEESHSLQGRSLSKETTTVVSK